MSSSITSSSFLTNVFPLQRNLMVVGLRLPFTEFHHLIRYRNGIYGNRTDQTWIFTNRQEQSRNSGDVTGLVATTSQRLVFEGTYSYKTHEVRCLVFRYSCILTPPWVAIKAIHGVKSHGAMRGVNIPISTSCY